MTARILNSGDHNVYFFNSIEEYNLLFSEKIRDAFSHFKKCRLFLGSYEDIEDFGELNTSYDSFIKGFKSYLNIQKKPFYFVFLEENKYLGVPKCVFFPFNIDLSRPAEILAIGYMTPDLQGDLDSKEVIDQHVEQAKSVLIEAIRRNEFEEVA